MRTIIDWASGIRLDGGREQADFTRRSVRVWAFVAAVFAVCGVILAASPIQLQVGKVPLQLAYVAAFLPLGLIYAYWRFDPKLASFCDAMAVGSAFILVGAPMTYIATWTGSSIEFWDARFLAMDQALGLDWLGYLAFVDARPSFGILLDYAYRSLLLQQLALVCVLTLLGLYARLQTFLLAFMIGLVLCAVGAALVPAIGIYNYLSVDALTQHPNFAIATMNDHVAHTLRMRGPDPIISLDALAGIIVFPSFHMALAVLFTWGFWRVPALRWVALGLNVLMAAATPLSGGHYFVDLLAGVAVALMSLAAARWMLGTVAETPVLFGRRTLGGAAPSTAAG